eukprot:350634-Pyramimonas_sp.AAC.1
MLMDKIAKETMADGGFGQSSTSTHYEALDLVAGQVPKEHRLNSKQISLWLKAVWRLSCTARTVTEKTAEKTEG